MQNICIKHLFHPSMFDSSAERGQDTDNQYRVAERNRYFRWSKKDSSREDLIDSIMRPFPIGSILITEERQANGKYVRDIQDGHHRADTINRFYKDEFMWGNKKYSELTPDDRATFDHTQICVQIMSRLPVCTDEEWRNECDDAFERTNRGKPLNNNDKFWGRKEEPLIKWIIETLKNDEQLRVPFSEVFGDVGGGKSRKYLAEMIALILVLMKNDLSLINPSFEINSKYVIQAIRETAIIVNDENTAKVKVFLAWYFALIKAIKEKEGGLKYSQGDFTKTGGLLGLVLADWIDGDANIHCEMWKEYAVACKKNKELAKKLFAPLPKGYQQNKEGIRHRVQNVIESYNPELKTFEIYEDDRLYEDEGDEEEEEVDY